MNWQHSDSRQQWELVAGDRVVGTIADEYLAGVPAYFWEDRVVPVMLESPWPDGRASTPSMETRTVPGLQTMIKRKFGLRLPDDAKPGAVVELFLGADGVVAAGVRRRRTDR